MSRSSGGSAGPGRPRLDAPTSDRLPQAPPCPFCEGRQTELMAVFGAHASVSTYWCRDCRSPFELLKWSGAR